MRLHEKTNWYRLIQKHKKDGYCFISASRNEIKSYYNKVQITKKLKYELLENGYKCFDIFGGYPEEGSNETQNEPSLFVSFIGHDFNEAKNYLMQLGRKYHQDSILICEPNSKPYYIYTSDTKDHKFGEISMQFEKQRYKKNSDDAYYSSLDRRFNDYGDDLSKRVDISDDRLSDIKKFQKSQKRFKAPHRDLIFESIQNSKLFENILQKNL